MMDIAVLWPYGKCVDCKDKGICADSQMQIGYCMSNNYIDFKPQTNAERIRAMTDEELAEWFGVDIDCCVCERMTKGCDKPCTTYAYCIEHWLNWLKQEVEYG